MKSVLIVSDFFMGGGLETRILDQVSVYQKHGVNCFLAVDEYNEEITKEFDEVLKLPLRAHDRGTIIKNTDALVEFCKGKNVEMLDVQPLYGVIAASFASAVLHLPMSYTLHSLYSTPPANDSLLTWFHVALQLRKPQMVLVAEYLKDHYSEMLLGADTEIIRNGVLPPIKHARKATGRKWIFASRLSEAKTKPLLEAIPILEKAGVEQLDIFGDGEKEAQVLEFVENFKVDPNHKMKVVCHGWCNSVMEKILNGAYEGGVGMDRVAVEMMSAGLPVAILGHNGLVELVSAKNFDKLMLNNFTSWDKSPEEEIVEKFDRMRKKPEDYNVRKIAKQKLNSKTIWLERLKGLDNLKTDLGRDAMLVAVWRDFYENEGQRREIERLQALLAAREEETAQGVAGDVVETE